MYCRASRDYYKMLEYIQEYLSSPDNSLHTVSAPLLLFIKVTLNCSHTISRFIELGMCVNVYLHLLG